MFRLRSKANAVIAAVALAIGGGAVVMSVAFAAPAHAYTFTPCLVHNGSDYLDDYGGGSGTYVHTYPYTNSPNQHWCLEAASQGGYYFHPENNFGLCLDAHTDNPGQEIWVYTCNGTAPQRWCWNGTGYIVRRTNSARALNNNCIYCIVTLVGGGANKWTFSGNNFPGDNC
jgi:Ricin-type beta-trefoil lectin domain